MSCQRDDFKVAVQCVESLLELRMDIPQWLEIPAKFLAGGAVGVSLIPIVIKLLSGWIHRESRLSMTLRFPDDTTVSIKGTKLDEEKIQRILEAFKTTERTGGTNE